jgi:hypothetical protein
MPAPKPAPSEEVYDASGLLEEITAQARPFLLNGEQFSLPAPTAWPDEAFQAANGNDPLGAARLILGEDEYVRFVKAGGNALFLQRLVEKLHGGSVGESSVSSSS